MSKLKRDVEVWSRRVRMSRARLWVVVEGANYDIPFYEGLLTDGAGLDNVEFIRAEEILVEGASAGGKSHAIKIFRHLESSGVLRQQNKETKVDVVFFIDRDDDDYVGLTIEHDHVQYTLHADIESEIVNNSDLPAALSRAFSVSRADAREHSPIQPAHDLASRWSDWISLRLAAKECGWSDNRFAQPSKINSPQYGPVDANRVDPICRRVESECPDWAESLERAKSYVLAASDNGEGAKLVKGKWLPAFIIHSVVQGFGPDSSLPRVGATQLLTACLMTVDFRQLWIAAYKSSFGAVLKG